MTTVNSKRLLHWLEELARIGALPGGGVCRLAFSDEDLKGREFIEGLLRKIGMEVRIDAFGNLFGVLKGSAGGSAIMIGSHTDTVSTGGRYDGALGALAAVEVASSIAEGPTPEHTIVVASFVNEEGVRFMPDMMGSLFHQGSLTLEDARGARDSSGISIGQEMDRLEYAGTDTLEDLDVGFFLELHIEQGPVLEDEKSDIGIVTGVQGISWTEVNVKGTSNHAGTTPMARRRDAGMASGRLMSELRDLPDQIDGLRLTIGSVRYHPDMINVIADEVVFTVDARHRDADLLEESERRIDAILSEEGPCSIASKSLARVKPCTFSNQVVSAVASAAETLGLSAHQMVSGAGHDAQILSSIYSSGMIFIPSRDGISHNIEEYSSPEQIVNGANVLLQATLALTGQFPKGLPSGAAWGF